MPEVSWEKGRLTPLQEGGRRQATNFLVPALKESNKYDRGSGYFTLDSKKDPETREITLYFVNGGDIPYVALSEYMPFVGEIYKDDKIGVPAVEYEISHPADNHTYVLRKDNSSSI